MTYLIIYSPSMSVGMVRCGASRLHATILYMLSACQGASGAIDLIPKKDADKDM